MTASKLPLHRLTHFPLGIFVAAILLGITARSNAQMVTGERMNQFGECFNVKTNQRAYPFNAVLAGSNIPANILWPGDQPTWMIQLVNNGDAPIKTAGSIEVIQYGTRGEPGEIWIPTVFKIAQVDKQPITVDIPAHGFQNVTITAKLPETFGGYGIVADLGASGRRFVFSTVRTFKPTTDRIQYPHLSLDNVDGDTLPRLGVQAIRKGVSWVKPDSKNYAKSMAALDAELKDDQQKNITVMLMIMGGDGGQPLGRPRPHLDDNGMMLETKSDSAWLPQGDEAFEQYVTEVTSKYGWPKGPVTAMSLWNEPWEGISISGWGADMLRYREIFRHMANGIIKARKDANVQVLIAGCDSSSNTIDKLFSDDSDEFLNMLDVCTIHYQGMHSPATYKKFQNRKGPNGRIKIWDTESWVANVDDRVAAVVAANRSAGYDRAMGVFAGNIWDVKEVEIKSDKGKPAKAQVNTAWSTAASIGAAIHFIGERPFDKLLFQNGLPWMMVFNGTANPDDGTVVVVGDLGDEFGRNGLLHRTVYGTKQHTAITEAKNQLANLPADASTDTIKAANRQLTAASILRDATVTFDSEKNRFRLFDFYGNPINSHDGKIVVPLDGRGFFLRTDGSSGSFAALAQAVSKARIDGIECLEMVPHDLLATIDHHPILRVTCTNVLNRPVTGTLTAAVEHLQLQPWDAITFEPNQTKEIEFKVTAGEAVPENRYPVTLSFNAGENGVAHSSDDIHVNLIAHRTISIDGKLDDWKGVLPQTVLSKGAGGPSMQEAAYLPFQKFDLSVKSGIATGFVAYDDTYFYFASKVAEPNPDKGTLRFADRDDDQFFYPQISYALDPIKTLATKPGKIDSVIRQPYALLKPDSSTERNLTTIESLSRAFKLNLTLPPGKTKRVSFYLLDNDFYETGRRRDQISIVDPQTNKVLDSREIKAFGFGKYVVYELSGNVEITFRNDGFANASLAGLFIDETSALALSQTSAHFVTIDEQTGGDWHHQYGKSGYILPGLPEQLPADIKVEIPQTVEKSEMEWPTGIRRYSYRKGFALPAGSAKFDNVLIAFNALPLEEDPVVAASLPGTPPMYTAYRDTDYAFALNKVAEEYGGGSEIWRLDVPDHLRIQFFPRQPKPSYWGAVKDGKLVVTDEGNMRITECAIPWHEIPEVKKLLDAGKPVKFDFRVNTDTPTSGMELAWDRAVSRENNSAFQPDWIQHWANELEFAFDKNTPAK